MNLKLLSIIYLIYVFYTNQNSQIQEDLIFNPEIEDLKVLATYIHRFYIMLVIKKKYDSNF